MALAVADLRRRGQVIRGVVEILQRIATLPDLRQTLVTGNLIGNCSGQARGRDTGAAALVGAAPTTVQSWPKRVNQVCWKG
jgi:hypothetical protein